jgi:sugar phosphate isomerase/epimerase
MITPDTCMPFNNTLVLNSTLAKSANLLTEIEVWRTTGFGAMEIHARKLEQYLQSGYSEQDLSLALRGVPVVGVGFVADIERQGRARQAMLREATRVFELAALVKAGGVQILTGPVDVQAIVACQQGRFAGEYHDLLRLSEDELITVAARNVAELADGARAHDLLLYLEPLSWTPINGLSKPLRLIEAAARVNVKLVVDYWHCFTSGVSPQEIAQLDKELIYGIHVCDSRAFTGGIPIETELRDVPTGQGILDLREWTAAVKATGYEGWWAAETFSLKMQQQPPHAVANDMRRLLATLLSDESVTP